MTNNRFASFFRFCLFIVLLPGIIIQPQSTVQAASSLTITPNTWNVIGLDSNSPGTGPYRFPIGARLYNPTGAAIDATVTFSWDDSAGKFWNSPSPHDYINLRTGSQDVLTLTVPAGGYADAFFEVEVLRNVSAYDKTRRYHIASVDAGGSISTPQPRELYVEKLISQNRNGVTTVKLNGNTVAAGGTMYLLVGQTYNITLEGFTATQGYNQFEDFINLPNTVFRVNSVNTNYAANTSGSINGGVQPVANYPSLYADSCGWDNDPGSPTYRSCKVNSLWKTGGNPVSTTYNVTILPSPTTSGTLNTLLYDFSGSSYHYNADYGIEYYFQIIDPAQVTISKSFSPKSFTPPTPDHSAMTITVSNPTQGTLTGIHFDDLFPTSPGNMTLFDGTQTGSCIATVTDYLGGSLNANDTGIKVSGITLAPNSSCTIVVQVKVSANGDYTNTTAPLYVNVGGVDTNTGKTAQDVLKVATTAACTPATLATWTVPGPAQPPDSGGVAGLRNVATATALGVPRGGGNASSFDFLQNTTWTTGVWAMSKPPTTITLGQDYFQFTVTTTGYQNITWSFNAGRATTDSPQSYRLYYVPNGGSETLAYTSTAGDALTNPGQLYSRSYTFSGTFPAGNTVFRFYPDQGLANGNNEKVVLDNISFSGELCPPPAPNLSKSFRNPGDTADVTTIALGTTSTLKFTIANTNPGNQTLTNVAFTDDLPLGLTVASGSPIFNCSSGGTGTVTSTAPRTISLSGASIGAGETCTFNVSVTGAVAGPYNNVSGYLSSTQTGTTTKYAEDNLDVVAPPTISKAFSPTSILTGGTSTLTFTLKNPNNFTSLTGVGFTDNNVTGWPAGVTVGAAGPVNACGGAYTTTAPDSLVFSGGSLTANESCSFSVTVTGTTAGTKVNTTGPITAAGPIPLTGNQANATLTVNAPKPLISLNKEISTDNTNWYKYVGLIPTAQVWYRFTLSNEGEADLAGVKLSDPIYQSLINSACPTLDPSGAGATLTVSPPTNVIICTITPGNITGKPDPNPYVNTATVTSTTYTPPTPVTSTAKYGTEEITLTKSTTSTFFTAGGQTIDYKYKVENTGGYPVLGPITVADSVVSVTPNVSVTVSCPLLTATAPEENDDNDAYLDPGEYITCTATYTTTTNDVTAREVTNDAQASAVRISGGSVTSNRSSVTVPLAPDLSVAKINSITGNTTNGSMVFGSAPSFDWTLTITNSGGPANFTDTQVVLTDTFPVTGATYSVGTITYSGKTGAGTVTCTPINSGNTFTMTCSANGGFSLANAGTITIPVTVTPTTVGTFDNPKSGGTCQVDPGAGTMPETNEGNNNCNPNTVTALASLTLRKSWVNAIVNNAVSITATRNSTPPPIDTFASVANTATETDTDVTPVGVSAGDVITFAEGFTTGLASNYTTTLACTGNANALSGSDLTVAATDTAITCTYTNTLKDATLTLQKTVTNDNGGTALATAWTLTATGPTTISGNTGGAAITGATVTPGTYTLGESGGPAGYTAGTWSCTNGVTVTAGQITLDPGQTTVCTINNNDNAPSLTLQKTVTNDDGGTAVATDWTLTATGADASPTNLSGTTPVASGATFKADTYTLGESGGPAGYTAGTWSCTNGVTVTAGQITLGLGQTTVCTINNNDILATAPQLTLTKTASAGPWTVGVAASYTLQLTNTGTAATTAVSTISDPIPTGLTIGTLPAGCSASGQDVTCTVAAGLAVGASTSFVIPVTPTINAASSVTNTASVSGGGDPTCPADARCSSSVTRTVNAPQLTLTKTASADPWTVGVAASYTLTLTNTGTAATTAVSTITDPIPTGLTIGTLPAGCSNPSGQDVTCTVASGLAVGASTSFVIPVTPTISAVSPVVNTASVTGGGDLTCPANARCSSSVTRTVNAPQLTLTKTASVTSFVVGVPASYTLKLENTGTTDTTADSTISDTIPTGLTIGTLPAGCSNPSGQDVTCTVAAGLQPGAGNAVSFVIPVTPTNSASNPVVNTASVSGGGDPTCPAAGRCTPLVATPVNNPSLAIVKEISTFANGPWYDTSINVTVGATVYYRVRVANTGNIMLTGLIVSDNIPACTLVRGPDITGDNDADFEVGEEWSYSCFVTAVTGTVNNTATADTTETQPVSDTASYTATAPSVIDPAISKAGDPTQASVGETVIFTLTVTNNGNAPAPDVVVTDPLPAMFDVVSVTSVYQAGGVAGTVTISPAPAPYTVTVNLGTLEVTHIVIITITTTVNGLGNPPINNTATVRTSAEDDPPDNNVSRVTIEVRAPSITLPATGFAPNIVATLPAQPQNLAYTATDVVLEVPSLGVKIPIVGVPKKNGSWDVTWLAKQAGWLEGSAFPSWSGNSVLTSHVYDANGLPGPFVNLSKLKYGDKVIVHLNGQKYIFDVRTNQVVSPNDASVFKHEEKSWLTLITCKEYDQKTDRYKKRVVVRAVLVKVEGK